MPRYLVIHADDFGLSPGVNQGILSSITEGPVRSTSLLVNFPDSLSALELAKKHGLDLGWHLNLVQGRPLTAGRLIPSLVDRDGFFLKPRVFLGRALRGSLKRADLHRELSAQRAFFADYGMVPSHVDGHLHMHAMPSVAPVLRELLRSQPVAFVRAPKDRAGWGAPRRLARNFLGAMPGSSPEYWQGTGARCLEFHGVALSANSHRLEAWQSLLGRIRSDAAEVMVHPAADSGEAEQGEYGALDRRDSELALLLGSDLKALIHSQGFECLGFRELLNR